MSDARTIFDPPPAIPPEHDLREFELANAYLIGGEVKRWTAPGSPSSRCSASPTARAG